MPSSRLIVSLAVGALAVACGGSGSHANHGTGEVALEKRAALLNRKPTALEKDVAQFSLDVNAWVQPFGVSLDEEGMVQGGDSAHPSCENKELNPKLYELLRRSLTAGDRPSRLALLQSQALLATCIHSHDSTDARKARQAMGGILIELSRPLAARKLFERELAWAESHYGKESREATDVILQRIADLWTSAMFSEAYGFFEQHQQLVRRYYPQNYLSTTGSFGGFACLNGRPSLALNYARRLQEDYRPADHPHGTTGYLAQIVQCLRNLGQENPAAALERWIRDKQSRALQAEPDATSPNALNLRTQDAMLTWTLGDTAGTIRKYEALVRDIFAEGPIQGITDPRFSFAAYALTGLERAQFESGQLRAAAQTLERLDELPPDSYVDSVGPSVMRGLGQYERSLALLDELDVRSQGWNEWFRLNLALERSRTLWAQGNLKAARDIFQESLAVGLGLLDLHRGGSESERRRAFENVRPAVDALVSMNLRAGATDAAMTGEAYGTLLITKGVLLDHLAADYQKLRSSGVKEDVELLEALQNKRQEIAARSIETPHASLFNERLELERLESLARERSLVLGGDPQPATPKDVQGALAKGEVLVEYFSFDFEDPKKPPAEKEKRTVAYVVGRSGPIKIVDLGPTGTIESAVEKAREALQPGARNSESRLLALGDLVFKPLLPLIGDARRLRIAPEGALHRVPFAALRTRESSLVDRFSITYIGTGREWVRLADAQGQHAWRSGHSAGAKGASSLSPVIVANPDFGEKGRAVSAPSGSSPFTLASRGARSAQPLPDNWGQLPGTGKEATRLSQLFPGGRTLVRQAATETALKSVQHPDILHGASPGNFLPPSDGSRPDAVSEDPLLHSGLVLAFANAGGRGVDDGFLTALEVTGMDLGGTQIATLSACETGLGQVNGEGIFGLRRALAIAGAESQLLSLWKVNDDATLAFMSAFYERVAQGESREEALLAVQRAMAAAQPLTSQAAPSAKKFRHPYYWSAFVLSGDPGRLKLPSNQP